MIYSISDFSDLKTGSIECAPFNESSVLFVINIDIMFYFTGSNFADHLTLPQVTLGFRRILLRHHFRGKMVNSANFVC
jgi:hypothetical protein